VSERERKGSVEADFFSSLAFVLFFTNHRGLPRSESSSTFPRRTTSGSSLSEGRSFPRRRELSLTPRRESSLPSFSSLRALSCSSSSRPRTRIESKTYTSFADSFLTFRFVSFSTALRSSDSSPLSDSSDEDTSGPSRRGELRPRRTRLLLTTLVLTSLYPSIPPIPLATSPPHPSFHASTRLDSTRHQP